MSASWYDPLTERWHKMPPSPVIERPKVKTEHERIVESQVSNIRIASHSKLWEAIEATATATQINHQCPAGSESDGNAS